MVTNVEHVMNVESVDSHEMCKYRIIIRSYISHSIHTFLQGELQFFTIIRTAMVISACFYTCNIQKL